MSNIREDISLIFQNPIQNMSFIAYFNYLNSGGKISARSIMEVLTVVCNSIEEQEKKSVEFEANFKEIQNILEKLVEKKTEEPLSLTAYKVDDVLTIKGSVEHDPVVIKTVAEGFKNTPEGDRVVCAVCKKEFKSNLALMGHSRSHKKKL